MCMRVPEILNVHEVPDLECPISSLVNLLLMPRFCPRVLGALRLKWSSPASVGFLNTHLWTWKDS